MLPEQGTGWWVHPWCPLWLHWHHSYLLCCTGCAAPWSLLGLPPPTMQPFQVPGLFWATCSQLSAAHHASCFMRALGSWARNPGILEISTSLSVGEGHNSLGPRSHAPLDSHLCTHLECWPGTYPHQEPISAPLMLLPPQTHRDTPRLQGLQIHWADGLLQLL